MVDEFHSSPRLGSMRGRVPTPGEVTDSMGNSQTRIAGVLNALAVRRLTASQRGISGTVAAGIILMLVGAILAFVALFGLIFLPVASFPVVDAEIMGVVGLVLAAVGAGVAALAD